MSKKVKKATGVKSKVISLLKNGIPQSEVAKKAGCSLTTVRYHAGRMGKAKVAAKENAIALHEHIHRAVERADLESAITELRKQISKDKEELDKLRVQLNENRVSSKDQETKIELLKELLLEANRR